MQSVVISKLGKFALITLSITGTSLLTANILSSLLTKTSKVTTNSSNFLNLPESFSTSRESLTVSDHTGNHLSDGSASHVSSPEKQISQTQHKKCKVVLTSADSNYKVVTCDDTPIRRSETWYLFDSKKNSLERLDGLTTKNDTGEKVFENTNLWWKSKKWQGYRGMNYRQDVERKTISSPFELNYVSSTGPFKFPFFDYLRAFCQGKEFPESKGLRFLSSNCTHFDIPTKNLRFPLIKKHFDQAFGAEQEKCFTGATNETELNVDNAQRRVMKWKEEENCSSHSSKK